MTNVKDITRESWILSTFPEWGTWLNEEIEEEVVPANNFAMWWLGNCGVWIKTPGGANVVMDLWSNRGKSTKKVKDMVWGHQMANMAGVRKLQPNLRVQPMVIDPFAINELDYYLVSHFHSDHIDINTAAAIVNNPKLDHVKFVGPYECGEIWKKWGVPEDRIIVLLQMRKWLARQLTISLKLLVEPSIMVLILTSQITLLNMAKTLILMLLSITMVTTQLVFKIK